MKNRKKFFNINNKGFTISEVMIAIVISSMILATIISLYRASDTTFRTTKKVSDAKEVGKGGMAQLEWLFQRWGGSTPCGNENPAQCTSVMDCRSGGNFVYPPTSTMCITITDNNPCDEVQFYANLYGNGFVHIPQIENPAVMNIKSCRLSTAERHNCYHIKFGAKFLRDQANPNVYTPLIFSLSNLSDNNLFCTDGTLNPNATISATATALNGFLKDDSGNNISTYTFEGGEIIMRVPHRIRLFCQNNPQDSNSLWLYMEARDIATNCNDNEPAQPLIPVNSFQANVQGQGININIIARGASGDIMNVQRVFGR